MATQSTDFLKFNAYRIKDLIVRKLSEDTRFTDQVYEGSNLNILIDLVSYMFQSMMYALNNAAAESMFSDTMLYENISRLCKFIGYNPSGSTPAGTRFYLQGTEHKGTSIPMYSQIDTGKTDSYGRKIYFSTIDDVKVDTNGIFPFAAYNGRWVLHPTVFKSNGGEYQTFTLDGVVSDSDHGRFVSNDHIHVWVREGDEINKWTADLDEMILNKTTKNTTAEDFGSVYTSQDERYTIRLNEDKTYEIKFGNGILGKIPEKNSLIYVFYLEGNGPDGMLYQNEVPDAVMKHTAADLGIPQNLYKMMFGEESADLNVSLYMNSTKFLPEESVSGIRESAPAYFKYGNRLITRNDYEYFIKKTKASDIIDVKCQNTMEYATTFLKWLYYYGRSGMIRKQTGTANGRYYLKANRLRRYRYSYADPADADNVFLWVKVFPNINDPDKYIKVLQGDIQERASGMKTLTHEITVLNCIDMNFAPCAAYDDYALEHYIQDPEGDIYGTEDTYIEVTLEDNSIYVNANIIESVATIIKDYFSEDNCTLGMKVDYNDILLKIMNLNGVQRVRTVYKNDETGDEIIKNGLSFATWSNSFLEPGEDLQISNSTRILEPFQFPRLNMTKEELAAKIKVIRKSLSNTSMIKY